MEIKQTPSEHVFLVCNIVTESKLTMLKNYLDILTELDIANMVRHRLHENNNPTDPWPGLH